MIIVHHIPISMTGSISDFINEQNQAKLEAWQKERCDQLDRLLDAGFTQVSNHLEHSTHNTYVIYVLRGDPEVASKVADILN